MSRKSGHRFSEKDMRQRKTRQRGFAALRGALLPQWLSIRQR